MTSNIKNKSQILLLNAPWRPKLSWGYSNIVKQASKIGCSRSLRNISTSCYKNCSIVTLILFWQFPSLFGRSFLSIDKHNRDALFFLKEASYTSIMLEINFLPRPPSNKIPRIIFNACSSEPVDFEMFTTSTMNTLSISATLVEQIIKISPWFINQCNTIMLLNFSFFPTTRSTWRHFNVLKKNNFSTFSSKC